MGAPFIIALGAAVLAVGYAGLKRSMSAVEARHQVWKGRDATATTTTSLTRKESTPLSMISDSDAGQVSGEVVNSFTTLRWLGGNKTAKSKTAVLAKTWDHRELVSFKNEPGILHIGTFGRVLGMSDSQVGIINTLVKIVLMSFDDLPNQDQIDDAGDQTQDAQDQAAEAERELEEAIARVEAELAALNEEMRVLRDQRGLIVGRLNAANADMDTLRDRDPPATPAELAAQQDIIDGIQGELDIKDGQIEAKQREIDAKEEELERWRQGRDDAANGQTGDGDDDNPGLPPGS